MGGCTSFPKGRNDFPIVKARSNFELSHAMIQVINDNLQQSICIQNISSCNIAADTQWVINY